MQAEKRTRLMRMGGAFTGLAVAVLLLFFIDEDKQVQTTYFANRGKVFGTYYTIRYEAASDMEDSIKAALQAFDNSLSMFNPHSTLSAINANRDTATDAFFETMFAEAQRVYALSDGAFDITVAPLVNLWGFGSKGRNDNGQWTIDEHAIDSLRQFVGLDKVQLANHRIIKADPRMQLDAGAVAKGQSCDVIAELLRRNGCKNYLVEIGGEVVCRGVNAKGDKWHIGITKPTENDGSQQSKLQEIIEVSDICMATSGNYRNFYYDGEQKRSHTIDPRTGKPVEHSLLSATVISSSCMRADAMATASMVLGEEKAMEMIARAGDAACYFIVARGDSTIVITSPNWEKMLQK